MKFYSGFSLQDESHFFDAFILDSKYSVCGFSYGAIKALQYTIEQRKKAQRIDTLQLFSPAFFQSKTEKFKRLQTLSYAKEKQIYTEQFINACFVPYKREKVLLKESRIEELKELLNYVWPLADLVYLRDSGVKIEVYLGSEDQIVDTKSAREFFSVATVTTIKGANHFLQTDEES